MKKQNLVRDKWAVVLCGGRGTRLGMYTEFLPKSLVKINGVEIMGYILDQLILHGFNKIVLPAGYLGGMIEDYARKYSPPVFCRGLDITVVDTGLHACIGKRISSVRHLWPRGCDFMLLNGDLIFDFDLNGLEGLHRESGSMLTMATTTVKSPFGLVMMQGTDINGFTRDQCVTSFNVYGDTSIGKVYSGICMLNDRGLDAVNISACDNFEAELYPVLIRDYLAKSFDIEGHWQPVDNPKDIVSAELMLANMEKAGERIKISV